MFEEFRNSPSTELTTTTSETRRQRRFEQEAELEKVVLKKKKKWKVPLLFKMFWFIFGAIFDFVVTTVLVVFCTGCLLLGAMAVYLYTIILPQSDIDLTWFTVKENSQMYHMNQDSGQYEVALTLHHTTSSIWKEYEELPESLLKATVAIEDKRFWDHNGVDWWRTGGAIYYVLFTDSGIQGGSTITQQLIKNLTTFNDVTVKRKVIEIFRALNLEKEYSKEEILQWYLNVIYLGDSNEGVGAASLAYFGKDVSELSLAESASLIAITNNPSYYGPYGQVMTVDSVTGETLDGKARNKKRQELILLEMYLQEMIDVHEYLAAKNEELVFVRAVNEEKPTALYTWFEEEVINDVREDLMESYGYSYKAASEMIASGGLSIYTTFDSNVQAVADSIYQNWGNLNVPSPNGQKLQSAITIVDNVSGDVVALVGQMGTKDKNLLYNFATEAKRQPGSAIKPLSVYAPALDYGLISPTTILNDKAYIYEDGAAWPRNAYGYYAGRVSLEYAVTNSSNAIAAYIVGDLLTPQRSFNYMTNMLQFDLIEEGIYFGQIKTDKDVAPLALGGLTEGVDTREMAAAYASFSNGGIFTASRTYTHVYNSKGDLILDNAKQQYFAMSSSTAHYMNDLLQQVINIGTGEDAAFDGMTIAGKTGTTNNNFDLWFVGYSPYYTAAVWTGYEYNEEIDKTNSPAMSMWKKVMENLHRNLPNRGFISPTDLQQVEYCTDSGCLPHTGCYEAGTVSIIETISTFSLDTVCSNHIPIR